MRTPNDATELTGRVAPGARERHVHAARRSLAEKRANKGQHTGGNIVPLDELLTLPDVMAITTMSRMTVYRSVQRGDLPPPIQVSRGRIAWRASAINQWMATRSETSPKAA